MLFAVPTFLGACLLFLVEPMLAKWLLPTLGGSPGTWSACLVAFQVLLLAGYAYADFSTRVLSLRSQARLHLGFVAVGALAALTLRSPSAPHLSSWPLALAVPWLLIGCVGLPYVVLASTTPLLSRWARSGASVSLYAVSNAGALVGLLAYPFLVEPFFDVRAELAGWAVAFVGYGVSMVPVCLVTRGYEEPAPLESPSSVSGRVLWLAYSFVPSVMLLAATNHITVDVAATPLLWVVPLSLYLVSFIVAFGVWRPSWRAPVLVLWVVGSMGSSMNAFAQGTAPLGRQIGATLLALFASSLLCHGELARERPPRSALTGYYLVIAVGGALGGVFVALVAPLVFADYYELELAAAGTFVALFVAARRGGPSPWSRASRAILFVGCGVCLPLVLGSLIVRTERETRGGRIVERRRSFLGPLRVVDVLEGRILTHGRIQHGLQLRDPSPRLTPTMYFGPGTAIERVFRAHHAERPRRVGVVGLGVGTLAAYGRPGDTVRFYELDQNVIDLARRDFTFLGSSAASIEVVLGDGRLSLARESPQAFDVLVLDAFSSDSVPVHLLTKEAFAVYLAHLAPDGILLLNVSNRHLAVDRVVRGSARAHGLACVFVETLTNSAAHVSHVEWALAARDAGLLAHLVEQLPLVAPVPRDVLWTDTRASLLAILR